MNQDEVWIKKWKDFFEMYPDLEPPRNSKWNHYLSQIRLGTGSWPMTKGFWEYIYSVEFPLNKLIEKGLYIEE